MKMNRRNALLGLGAIATGGGAVFGSGAFSSVQADRQVSIQTVSDSGARLGLAANSSIANDTDGAGGNQLAIDASQLNPNATTEFDAVFDITNNAGSGPRYVAISSVTVNNGTATFFATNSGNPNPNPTLNNEVSDLSTDYVEIANGATLTVGLSFNADDASGTTDTDTVTIEAVDEDGSGAFTAVGTVTAKGGTVS